MLIQRMPTSLSLKNYWRQLPDLSLSHILLRIPLSFLFINQGLSKFPFDPADGQDMDISALVWWFVSYAQIAAGLGLLVGGLASLPKMRYIAFTAVFGDLVTRFSGIFFMGWRSLFRFAGKLGSGH